MLIGRKFYFAADSGAGGGQGDPGQGGDPSKQAAVVYETWITEQPAEVKTAIEGHITGLKTALESERVSRKDLEKQLRELAGKAEKDSDAQKRLTEMADQMGEADRKADFYEAAHAAGVANLKLAYLVAQQDELFDRRGQVNFETMKGSYPELFGAAKKAPAANAGAGTNNNQAPAGGMNAFIRQSAGRG